MRASVAAEGVGNAGDDVVNAPGPGGAPGRPLRKDAARNRERVLAAAGRVFDTQGLDATVADVAREAGVGMGTLYRRFPTKEALIEALVEDMLEAAIQTAKAALLEPDGSGLEHFLRAETAHLAEHPGCLPKLWTVDHELVKTACRLIAQLLSDAKRHGQVRADLTSTDVTMAIWSMRGVLDATREVAYDAWQRYLDLLIAGMRPAAQPLTHRPISQSVMDRIVTQV